MSRDVQCCTSNLTSDRRSAAPIVTPAQASKPGEKLVTSSRPRGVWLGHPAL